MIILIDDDSVLLEIASELIKETGYESLAFESVNKALEYMQKNGTPELIISDVMMPNMDGFQLKERVEQLFPSHSVPFFFLSSLSREKDLVRGIEAGVDEYLTKPLRPNLFKAKVKSILSSATSEEVPLFRGDLAKMPFVKLLQFCEKQKMHGKIKIKQKEFSAWVRFKGGQVVYEEFEDKEGLLEKIMDLHQGDFEIYQEKPDLEELADVLASPGKLPSLPDKIGGKLSAAKLGKRIFQIQTEYISSTPAVIVTQVNYKGKTVYRKDMENLNDKTTAQLEKLLIQQHQETEIQIKNKIARIRNEEGHNLKKKSRELSFEEYFDAGLEKYMAKNYEEAYKIWKKAKEIRPDDQTLDINLKILAKKLN
ncbi:MAG: response regulator [Deltaproteobacteria bacterium]|jgi:DNA-binding response OmpR family regulator|nr:response regulator [Deltaproteobacteria bacterium]